MRCVASGPDSLNLEPPSVSLSNMMPIKDSEFGEDELKQGVVWTWTSDLHTSEDSLVQVPLTEEALSEADSLLIRAVIVTGAGRSLNGLVVYHMGKAEVFAIEVMLGREKFTFNKYLSEFVREELARLASFLKEDVEGLLPIRYSIVPKQLAINDGEFTF